MSKELTVTVDVSEWNELRKMAELGESFRKLLSLVDAGYEPSFIRRNKFYGMNYWIKGVEHTAYGTTTLPEAIDKAFKSLTQ